MVIDTHIRPALFGPICRDRDRFRKRCDEMNYHLMGPSDMDLLKKQYALADIQKISCCRMTIHLKQGNQPYPMMR